MIANCSIVATAQSLNPGILNPDFLLMHGIVEKDWEVIQNLTLPPFSEVRYANGCKIQVESNKASVTYEALDNAGLQLEDIEIANVAMRLFSALGQTQFLAVGNNFLQFVRCANPAQVLRERFFNTENINIENHPAPEVTFKLVYEGDPTINLGFSSGLMTVDDSSPAEVDPMILVTANFHREINSEDFELLSEPIQALSQDHENLESMLDSLIDLEG